MNFARQAVLDTLRQVKVDGLLAETVQLFYHGLMCWMRVMRIQVSFVNKVHNDAMSKASMVGAAVFSH